MPKAKAQPHSGAKQHPQGAERQQTGTFTIDDLMEAVREDRQKDIEAGREFYPMNEERTRVAAGRVEVAAKVAIVKGAQGRKTAEERQEETSPMDYSDMHQEVIDEGILADKPAQGVEPQQAYSAASPEAPAIMNLCDNGLVRAAAFLHSADKAATRFHDAHISAQAELTIAKLEWAKEAAGGETWMQRCARVIPHVSQRKIDDVVAGRFPKIAQDTAELPTVAYEARLKAMAEANGLPYYTPEEREARHQELMELMIAKRKEILARAQVAAREVKDQERSDCAPEKTEKDEARRGEAETIRADNGGKPAHQRLYGVHKELFAEWLKLGKSLDQGELLAALNSATLAVKKHRKEGWTPVK